MFAGAHAYFEYQQNYEGAYREVLPARSSHPIAAEKSLVAQYAHRYAKDTC